MPSKTPTEGDKNQTSSPRAEPPTQKHSGGVVKHKSDCDWKRNLHELCGGAKWHFFKQYIAKQITIVQLARDLKTTEDFENLLQRGDVIDTQCGGVTKENSE